MSQRKQAADEGSGNDHPNSDAPIPANVVVALSDVFTDKSVDMSGNEGVFMGGEGGLIALIHIIMANSGCRGMCLTRFARLDLTNFFIAISMLHFFLLQYSYCDVQ